MPKNNRLFFKVLEILKEKQMTQTELAKKAGITQPSLSRILAGKYNVKISILEKIAEALDVPAGYLLEEQEFFEKKEAEKKESDTVGNNLIIKLIEEQNQKFEEKIKRLENEIELMKVKKSCGHCYPG